MERIEFETYEDFVCEVSDKLDIVRKVDEYENVAIIAKYDEANAIVRELLCMGYDIASIHLGKEEFDEYYDEYIISIDNIDGDTTEVWCEPFKRGDKYIIDDSVITFVMDNCSSACIPNCKGDVVIEVGIGNDECDSCECCDCTDKDTDDSESTHISRDKHGNPLGFSKTWSTVRDGVHCYSSYSHYSSDVNMLRSIASDFGVKL